MKNYQNSIFIAIIYFLFTFGYIASKGFYHVGELFIILITSVFLFGFYLKPALLQKTNIPKSKNILILLLTLILSVNAAQLGAMLGDSSQVNWMYFSALNRLLTAIALILALSYFLTNAGNFFLKHRFFLLILIAFLIRIFSIISAPNPTIDVFYILRDGPATLLAGKNPYELSYPAPYGVYIPTIIFVYGPLVPFIFLPSVLIFNDPRYMLIIADAISLLAIYKISKETNIQPRIFQLVALIFLFHPLFPFMTEQAWLEPTITSLFLLAVYAQVRYKKSLLPSMFLGLILAIKSVYILPLLTFLYNARSKLKSFILLITIPIAFSIPFILANAQLFLNRTQIYVSDPQSIAGSLAPTNISLSISAVILKYTKIVIPTSLVAFTGLITSAIVVYKKHKELAFTTLSTFLVFITLFMFGPFVFLHYFTFLGNILLITLVLFCSNKNYE